jgi:cob(I)alamin adenosyltransferase
MKEEEIGITQVYTGHGKGKTTAALGQAVRFLGWKKKVLLVQFLKKGNFGEINSLKLFSPDFKLIQSGPTELVEDWEELKNTGVIRDLFGKVEKIVISNKYDLIILDELLYAVHMGLIGEDEVVKLIENKPKELEMILTGRNATKEILIKADLVTEMKEVKHPFNNGLKCKKGREF